MFSPPAQAGPGDKYVCQRALTSHPRPTRSTPVTAATNTTHSYNTRYVGECHTENSEVGGRSPHHFLAEFEFRLKQLKLGFIAYNNVFSVAGIILLKFVLIFNCVTRDKSLLLAGPANLRPSAR